MDAAKTTYNAMQDLRAGRITVDEYRAIMREQRDAAGSDTARNVSLLAAFAADTRG